MYTRNRLHRSPSHLDKSPGATTRTHVWHHLCHPVRDPRVNYTHPWSSHPSEWESGDLPYGPTVVVHPVLTEVQGTITCTPCRHRPSRSARGHGFYRVTSPSSSPVHTDRSLRSCRRSTRPEYRWFPRKTTHHRDDDFPVTNDSHRQWGPSTESPRPLPYVSRETRPHRRDHVPCRVGGVTSCTIPDLTTPGPVRWPMPKSQCHESGDSPVSSYSNPKIPTPLCSRQPGTPSYVRPTPTRGFYHGTMSMNPEPPKYPGSYLREGPYYGNIVEVRWERWSESRTFPIPRENTDPNRP